ncbi:hypothetical protein ACFQL4_18405 [Halosimplex aquaticum]
MTPKLTDKDKDESTNGTDFQERSFDGEPKTDSDSKTVLIAGERNDRVEITNIVSQIDSETTIPSELSILRRSQRYYGPELLLHSKIDGADRNFLLTAPGPTDQLQLWLHNRPMGPDARGGRLLQRYMQFSQRNNLRTKCVTNVEKKFELSSTNVCPFSDVVNVEGLRISGL